MNTNSDLADDLAHKFEPALADIIDIQIRPLDDSRGAFHISDGCMEVNESDIAGLMSYVIADMAGVIANGAAQVSTAEVQGTLHDTASLFVLHELRHRTQGVSDYGTVQILKKIDVRDRLSRFDIQADRDAALALAAARVGTCEGDEFIEYYQKALYYSVDYFFQIYPANVDRIDKVCRVAALLLMLARLEINRKTKVIEAGLPTDALHVIISEDRSAIAVIASEPSSKLLAADNDVEELREFVCDIENGDVVGALSRALRLSTRLGLN